MEARYYIHEESSIRCQLCPHQCRLIEGATGLCRTRQVVNGRMVSTAYGHPEAIHTDPIEKKPLYHFLPGSKVISIGTRGCNLRCLGCQNDQLSQQAPAGDDSLPVTPAAIVQLAVEKSCPSIAYTYSDPVAFYEYMLDIAELANAQGINNILVSAGYINPQPLKRLMPCLQAANIDLKAFTDQKYLLLAGARLRPVLKTLESLIEAGVWLEITHLVVPGITDNPKELEAMCAWVATNLGTHVPIHFSRFFPRYKLLHLSPTPLHTLETAADIARQNGLKRVYVGNVPELNQQNTLCSGCGCSLIVRQGYHQSSIVTSDGLCPQCQHVIEGVWR